MGKDLQNLNPHMSSKLDVNVAMEENLQTISSHTYPLNWTSVEFSLYEPPNLSEVVLVIFAFSLFSPALAGVLISRFC